MAEGDVLMDPDRWIDRIHLGDALSLILVAVKIEVNLLDFVGLLGLLELEQGQVDLRPVGCGKVL